MSLCQIPKQKIHPKLTYFTNSVYDVFKQITRDLGRISINSNARTRAPVRTCVSVMARALMAAAAGSAALRAKTRTQDQPLEVHSLTVPAAAILM